eukprot:s1414_g9.t1
MLRSLVILQLLEVVVGSKIPTILWGQKPDRLYLSFPLQNVREPEVELEERRLYFKGISQGHQYEVDLKLLRGINVSTSKYDMGEKAVSFDLPKLANEPCWKRLTRSKKMQAFIKKDNQRLYPEECYRQMLQWREAYFYRKLHPEEDGSKSEEMVQSQPTRRREEEFRRTADGVAKEGGSSQVQEKEIEERLERVVAVFPWRLAVGQIGDQLFPCIWGLLYSIFASLAKCQNSNIQQQYSRKSRRGEFFLREEEAMDLPPKLRKVVLSACQATKLLSAIFVHSTWTLCCFFLALLRLLWHSAPEQCDGVQFLEGHVTHARSVEAKHAFRYAVRFRFGQVP